MNCPQCAARATWRVGQTLRTPTTTPANGEQQTEDDFRGALRQLTPSLLVVGIATGAAFAIGSGLVSHYLFPRK